jgi:hypothetical protein
MKSCRLLLMRFALNESLSGLFQKENSKFAIF